LPYRNKYYYKRSRSDEVILGPGGFGIATPSKNDAAMRIYQVPVWAMGVVVDTSLLCCFCFSEAHASIL
jgi:hypothetical protein